MNVWFYFTVLAIGAVQGLVMGVLLWHRPSRRRYANRWLAAMLLFFTYPLLTEILRGVGFISVERLSYHLFLEYNWIYGPLLFFYVRAYLDDQFRFQRRDWVHFVPVGLEFLISNFIKTQNFFWDGTRESLSWAGYYGYILWVQTPFPVVVAFVILFLYAFRSRRLLEAFPGQLPWLRQILTAVCGAALILPLIAVIDYLFFDYAFHPFYIFPLYAGTALLLYWLGLAGFIHRDDQLTVPPDELQQEQWRNIILSLEKAMREDHLYRNPELNIDNLAEALGEKAYRISQALNRQIGKSFSDYVNEHRVFLSNGSSECVISWRRFL